MKLKKAVFPVAGMGLRFLPATKANPKEMLPIVDKPLIQYAVEEAINAGLTEMIFVTSSSKRAIEDHFDRNNELESKLLEKGYHALYDVVKAIAPDNIHFTYVRQHEALGLGHALLCARHVVNHEPFAVLLADDLLEDGEQHCLSEMVKHYEKTEESIVAVQAVSPQDVDKYGIVDIEKFDQNQQFKRIQSIVEKPSLENAPSHYAAVGRYIFTPEIFNCLEVTSPDHRNEVQVTDAIEKLIHRQGVNAFCFTGRRYDCGSKLGYVKATVEYGLKHPDIGDAFKQYWKEKVME
jgi:UTP--glucose-1-phosphate uridylyltransferase